MGLGSIVPGLEVFHDFVFCQRQVSFNSFLGSFQIFFTKSINQPDVLIDGFNESCFTFQ